MSKVTSKLQVTIPKALADRYGIRPGDEIEWEAAGTYIRVIPSGRGGLRLDAAERRRIFEAATARQRAREAERPLPPAEERGWTREELYERDGAR